MDQEVVYLKFNNIHRRPAEPIASKVSLRPLIRSFLGRSEIGVSFILAIPGEKEYTIPFSLVYYKKSRISYIRFCQEPVMR
jgi:hypothetical protein